VGDGFPVTNERDVRLTRHALELASLGIGRVSPSPLVGCVITDASGEIVGEGTYIFDDVTHAEVIALAKAGERAKGGTAYVSLEPHSHHGKTPPCTDALINAGIARVVCPIEDPNPLVSGKGFARLRDAGVEVVTGVLAGDATRQNEKFICWHQKGRPFVHLKLAMSLDGRISLNSSMSTALSGAEARDRVQDLRHEHDAILVGSNTAVVDDPMLTDRSGKVRRRPLTRLILDGRLRTTADLQLARTAHQFPTVIFTNSKDSDAIAELKATGTDVVALEGDSIDLVSVLAELKQRDIQSVLVEGGSEIAGAFVDARLVDKITFIYSPLIVGGDAPTAVRGKGVTDISDTLRLTDVSVAALGADIEITGYPA
jgi:diaminohydroxyphosphoribosylaminopyrimidine deaminase/5-amino-6-(5-phosphoribosylamino)uracil reductase